MAEQHQNIWNIPGSTPSDLQFKVGELRGSFEPLVKQVELLAIEVGELRKETTRIDKQTFRVGVTIGVIASLVGAVITILAGGATSLLIQWLAAGVK